MYLQRNLVFLLFKEYLSNFKDCCWINIAFWLSLNGNFSNCLVIVRRKYKHLWQNRFKLLLRAFFETPLIFFFRFYLITVRLHTLKFQTESLRLTRLRSNARKWMLPYIVTFLWHSSQTFNFEWLASNGYENLFFAFFSKINNNLSILKIIFYHH